MSVYLDDGDVVLHLGDCVEVMAAMEPESVDAVVCDPPYDLLGASRNGSARTNVGQPGNPYAGGGARAGGFMGKAWDATGVAFEPATWREALRVLRPGGHLLAFGGTRTFHRLTCAIEDAGFEVRDCLSWLYGSGFPKSLDVSKAIDKRGGADIGWFGPWLREERGRRGITAKALCAAIGAHGGTNHGGAVSNWELGLNLPTPDQFNALCEVLELPFAHIAEAKREAIGTSSNAISQGTGEQSYGFAPEFDITAPATPEASAWQGWGTALAPAWEPIVVARKPLSGTVASTVLTHGTGAINVDACRIGKGEGDRTEYGRGRTLPHNGGVAMGEWSEVTPYEQHPAGRWPKNVVLDEEAAARLDEEVGELTSGHLDHSRITADNKTYGAAPKERQGVYAPDTGGPSRFFYTAKASSAERDGASHPTVKPLALMRWLVRLVTPPGGLVLDPFAGSGTTLLAAREEGFRAIGIEREEEYAAMAAHRLRQLSLFGGAA